MPKEVKPIAAATSTVGEGDRDGELVAFARGTASGMLARSGCALYGGGVKVYGLANSDIFGERSGPEGEEDG